MSLIIPAGYYQHTIAWTNADSGHKSSCAYGIESDGGATITTLLTDLNNAWKSNLGTTHLGSAWTMTDGTLEDSDIKIDAPIDAEGSGGGSPSPNVSLLVKKVCAERGKANRGRFYLPAGYLAPGEIDAGGNIESSYLADVQTNMDNLYSDLIGVSGVDNLSLLHSATGLAPVTILSFSAEALVATQRRRLR